MAQGYYLYGVIEASKERIWEAPGVQRQEVRALVSRDIAVVASPWTSDVVRATPANCLAHERVLCDVVKTETVLPFEFGTIAPDLEAVNKLLRRNYAQIRRALGKLSGAVEVNVTALWHDMKAIFEEVVKAHPMIATYKREIMSKPYEQTYQDRLRIGQVVAEALDSKRHMEGEKLFKVLKSNTGKACQDCMGKPVGDNVIFIAAFLVKRDAYSGFEQSLLELGSRHDGRVDFKYTDPLPPYHFIDLKIAV
ncbi:MAG: GvpL/GvpF family gas vesicle protein [Candidatus Acidiferrum sp.]|jgi:hypothetical protein